MAVEAAVDSINQAEWEEYARNFSDYSIYQTWPYQQTRAEIDSQSVKRIVIKDEKGRVETMCQVRIKHIKPLGLKIGYVQRGPLLRDRQGGINCSLESLELLRETLLGKSVNVLRLTPNVCEDEIGRTAAEMLQSAGFAQVPNVKPYRTFILAVDDAEEEIRKRLRKSFRRDLKKAEESGIEIREGCDNKFCDILEKMHAELLCRKNFKGVNPQEYFKAHRVLSAHEKMNIIAAYLEGEPVAALLASNLGDTAVVLLAASNEKGLACGSSYLIWWKGAVAAWRAGLKRYDLGGIDPQNNPSVHQFKSRMGGKDVFHIGAYEATTNWIVRNTWRISERIYRLLRK